LLGNWDKLIAKMYGEENNILSLADWSSQGRTKISCIGEPNEPTKEGHFS
jgi:hypothetical protein